MQLVRKLPRPALIPYGRAFIALLLFRSAGQASSQHFLFTFTQAHSLVCSRLASRSYQQVTQSVLKYMQCIDVGPKHVVFSVPVLHSIL
jgi:hypothetical protein